MCNNLKAMQEVLAAEIDAAERVAGRTDADLYAVEQTGFFSRKLAETQNGESN